MDTLKSENPDYQIYSMEEFTSLFSVNNIAGLREFIGVIMAHRRDYRLRRSLPLDVHGGAAAHPRNRHPESAGRIQKLHLRHHPERGPVLWASAAPSSASDELRRLLAHPHPGTRVHSDGDREDWWLDRRRSSRWSARLLGALYPGLSAARHDPIEASRMNRRRHHPDPRPAQDLSRRQGGCTGAARRGSGGPEGEFLSIIGPSGSGKSTLFHIIGGLTPPTSGQVEVGGQDLADHDGRGPHQLRKRTVAFVFQKFNLLPNLTARDNIAVARFISGSDAKPDPEFEEILRLLGIADRLDHKPNALSGGEQQRVAIARADRQSSRHPAGRRADRQSRHGELKGRPGSPARPESSGSARPS